ncbi:MAG TPA: BON domain-containing protein, partial [Terriglobales bacterium]|nr:BON domain-containing protein [Terriglobales bacterium]
MKAKLSLYSPFAALLVAAALAIGCTHARTDAALAQDVQQKLLLDQAIGTKQIQVASDHGIVTLAGTVASEAERDAAAADAAKVDGVKTVVNNLSTAPVQAAEAAPVAPTQLEPPAPEPVPTRSSRRPSAYRERTSSRNSNSPRSPVSSVPSGGFGNPASSSSEMAQNSAPAPAVMTPPPPPVPTTISVPEGTELQVRLDESISSNKNHSGDTFHGSLDQPVVLNDDTVIPAHADVTGRVVEAVAANRLTGQPSLAIEVTRLSYN